jgi:uroporphyrinogen III methyltransferase/synthase
MLTDRNFSSQVVLVTGHEAEGKEQSNIDWHWLAKFNGTIVLYMAVTNLDYITAQLVDGGMSTDAPVAAIRNATLPNQLVIKTTLDKLVEERDSGNIQPPSIIVIGPGAAGDTKLEWFVSKPLFGQNICITRDDSGNVSLAENIIGRGGNPVSFPMIKIKSLTNSNDFINILADFKNFDWIIFTSVNGVELFFRALDEMNKDARVFASAKIAAIGPRTAQRLEQNSINADFVPDKYTSKELAIQLIDHTNLDNKKILLLRSKQASDDLPQLLKEAGSDVTEVPVYTIEPAQSDAAPVVKKIKSSQINWLTFASPSSAKNFFALISPDIVNTNPVKVASIGPVTTKQLNDLDVKVDLESPQQTLDALLDAIEAQK